jgi:hypothetical protein
MNSLFENRNQNGFTKTTKPCGHNNLSTTSLGFTSGTGKEFKVCNTCNKMHRRWWWKNQPNGWVGLA